jgi:hypothetical protein
MPIVNISEWCGSGLEAVYYGARGSGGFFTGFAKLTSANTGTASGMRMLKAAINAPIAMPAPKYAPRRGNNRLRRRHVYSGDPSQFKLDTTIRDLNAEGFLQGSAIKTIGDWDFGLVGPGRPNLQDTMLHLTRYANAEEGEGGEDGWDNLLLFNINGTPLGDDTWRDSEGSTVSYDCKAEFSTVTPFGTTIPADFTLQDGIGFTWWSANQSAVVAFVGNGTLAAIPLNFTPISSAKTKFWLTEDGSALTVSSVDASAKTATLSAALASGKLIFGIYEHTGFPAA